MRTIIVEVPDECNICVLKYTPYPYAPPYVTCLKRRGLWDESKDERKPTKPCRDAEVKK